jgi:hypothetical protein
VTLRSKYYFYLLTGLLALLVIPLYAQENDQTAKDFYWLKEYFDRSYGSDYNLLNGKYYQMPYINAIGHPFFNSDQFRKGSLLVNGVYYDVVMIRYDLYNQSVVLMHIDYSGRMVQLELSTEFIDEFTLDGKLFRKMSFPETGIRFFQVVYTGEISCYLTWKKNLVFMSTSVTNPYTFTSQSRKVYLYVSGQLRFIKSVSSLIEIFGSQYKKEIRRYKRRHGINLRNVSDESLRQLIEYCINLTDDKL